MLNNFPIKRQYSDSLDLICHIRRDEEESEGRGKYFFRVEHYIRRS